MALQSNYTGQSSISHSGSLSGQPSGGYNQPQPQQQQLQQQQQQQAQFSGAYNQQYSQPHGGYTISRLWPRAITNWLSTTTTTSTTTITTQTKYGIHNFATTLQQQQLPPPHNNNRNNKGHLKMKVI